MKRLQEILVSTIALVLLSPVVALLVRQKLGYPILFRKIRPDLNGISFKMAKFIRPLQLCLKIKFKWNVWCV